MWLTIASAGLKAIGGIADANMQAGQLRAESRAEGVNAQNLWNESLAVGAAGARREEQARREYRQFAGDQAASLAESGGGLEGSALDVVRDSEAQGYLDALNIRHGAQEQARTLRNSSRQARYRSTLAAKMAPRAKLAGYLGAFGQAASDAGGIFKQRQAEKSVRVAG